KDKRDHRRECGERGEEEEPGRPLEIHRKLCRETGVNLLRHPDPKDLVRRTRSSDPFAEWVFLWTCGSSSSLRSPRSLRWSLYSVFFRGCGTCEGWVGQRDRITRVPDVGWRRICSSSLSSRSILSSRSRNRRS